MSAQREPGIEYGLWWLAAALGLPLLDLVVVLAANAGLLAVRAPGALPLALILAALANLMLLHVWGARLGISMGTTVAAVLLSCLAAVVVFVIFVYAVVAPALA